MFIIVLSRQFLYEDRSGNVEFELLDFQPVLSGERSRIGRKQGENEMLGWILGGHLWLFLARVMTRDGGL